MFLPLSIIPCNLICSVVYKYMHAILPPFLGGINVLVDVESWMAIKK